MPTAVLFYPSTSRVAAVLALLVLTASPTLGQFKPRFRTVLPISVSIGGESGKQAFTLADVNNDRRLDIITIEPGPKRVDVYLNLGDGAFDLHSTPSLIGNDVIPTAVTVADIGSTFASNNGRPDGKPDIVVGGDGGEVEVFYGRNDGNFEAPEVVFEPTDTTNVVGLVTGDFDRANGTDVALLDDDGVVLLCNDGSGNLAECSDNADVIEVGSSPIKIVKGDFDADGDLDLATLDTDEQKVAILLGNGDGTFAAPATVDVTAEATDPNDTATDMDVARIDGDNVDDIAAVNSSTFNQLFGAVIFGNSTGRFRVDNTFVVDFDATALTLADFDGASDRAIDAIMGFSGDTSGVRATIGDGTGDFPADPFSPSGTGSIGDVSMLASGDLGGDTLPDFVALNPDGTQLRVAINISNEATPTPGTMTPSPEVTPSPTVTGPPPPTSTVTPSSTPTATVTATNTPTPIPTANFGRCDGEVGTSLAAVAAGDLDGDGLPDLAASDSGAGVVRIVFNSATLSEVKSCAMAMTGRAIASTSVDLGGRTPGPIAIADLDRDGANDIAVGAGDRVILLKRTAGTFAPAGEIVVGGTVRAITATYPNRPSEPGRRGQLDLNGDGVTDLLIANGTTTLTIVYGVAQQLPGRTVTQLASCPATSMDAADFNDDGRIDIAVGCGNTASWVQQQQATGDTPVFQVKGPFGSGPIVGLAAGYLNGDSLTDLLITRGGSSPAGDTYTFVLAANGSFAVGDNPIAGGLGRLNPSRNRFDAVIGGQDGSDSVLQFAYNDGAGGFPGPVVMPFLVHNTPRGLTVVDFDNDGQQDVALANSDGTLTILVSSEPPPTPTPTNTPTATATGTATQTETPSMTPTPSDTPTSTPTITPTPTPTVTRTGTPGNTPTPTNTRGGIVLGSCAIGDQGGSSPLQMGLIAALLAGARLLAARRARRVGAENVRSR